MTTTLTIRIASTSRRCALSCVHYLSSQRCCVGDAGAASVAMLATTLAMAPLIYALKVLRVVDVPNYRSSHSVITPRGGGLAVIAGLIAGAVVGHAPYALWGFLALALLGASVGLADDVRGLPVRLRLTAQAILSALLVLAVQFSDSPLGWGMAVVTIVGVVGYVNAFNFMDGINGISAFIGITVGVWFVISGYQIDDRVLVLGGFILLGSCLGFLPWNVPGARIFLGDVGSYGLGFLIAALAVRGLASGQSLLEAAAPLTIYLADTSATLVRRMRRGDSWREPHREHVYQLLCANGLTHIQTAAVVAIASGLTCLTVYLPSVWAAGVTIAAIVSAYLALPWLPKLRRTTTTED